MLIDELKASGAGHGDAEPGAIELRTVLSEFRSKRHFATFWVRGVRVEMFVPWHPFHSRVLDRSPERDLEGRAIRIHGPEDLIVFKKIFDRPKDIQDIKAILISRRGSLNLELVRREARELLTDESYRDLEQLLLI